MSRYAPWINWIDTQQKAMYQTVIEWANINSGSRNLTGLNRMADVIRNQLAILQGNVETLELLPGKVIDSTGRQIDQPLGPALRVVKRAEAPLRCFLGIHFDTVYSENHPFQTATAIDANTLRGPGVADAKGGLVVMLKALEALERSPFAFKIGWELLINPDEEIGSPGSASLFTAAAGRNHLGLLFEPALPGGALVDRRRGVGEFTVVLRGRSAHAGRDFERGRSAVLAMAEFVLQAHSINGLLRGVTVNVGRVEGGGATNVVPDLAICRLNVRTTQMEDQSRVLLELNRLVQMANARDGITAELIGSFTSPPKLPDGATHALMTAIGDCGQELDIPISWGASGGACDGNKLAAAGLVNIDSLGPRGGDIHSPNEYILVDSLTERAKLVALLLMKLASGEITWPPAYA